MVEIHPLEVTSLSFSHLLSFHSLEGQEGIGINCYSFKVSAGFFMADSPCDFSQDPWTLSTSVFPSVKWWDNTYLWKLLWGLTERSHMKHSLQDAWLSLTTQQMLTVSIIPSRWTRHRAELFYEETYLSRMSSQSRSLVAEVQPFWKWDCGCWMPTHLTRMRATHWLSGPETGWVVTKSN